MKERAIKGIACFLVLGCFCTISFASSMLDLTNKQSQIEAQAKEANIALEEVQEELSDMMLQIQELNDQIASYETEAMQLGHKMVDLEKSITELQEGLAKSQKSFEIQKKALEERLITLYEAGETSYLDVLLHSKNISDFISNYYLISEITKYDTDLLDTIETEKISIETRKKTLEGQMTQLKQAKVSKEETAIMLTNLKVVKNRYINQLTEAEQDIQGRLDEYNKQLQEIDAEILLATYQSLNSDYVGGVMAWPAPGYTTITSPFGMRIHPIFKIPRFHPGVDIGVPTGGKIIAVNDGVVIKTTYTEAYGFMVMVDHGGGVVTLYAHASEITVQVGQEVKRGDQVIKAGSTGWSTGPHLHFEVRVNGECVDPIGFITTKRTEAEN